MDEEPYIDGSGVYTNFLINRIDLDDEETVKEYIWGLIKKMREKNNHFKYLRGALKISWYDFIPEEYRGDEEDDVDSSNQTVTKEGE